MSSPTVWCLLAGRAGDDAQVLALARALEWPFVEKRLRFNRLCHAPNLMLGASLASLDRRASDALSPPWPDVVIAAARHSAPVACWIKKRSGGRARLVHLQYAEMPLDRFDLVITMPHFCLPRRDNVVEVAAPLNRPDPERMAEAERKWHDRLAPLPKPRTSVLVGGSNSIFGLDEDTASRLGRELSRHVRSHGGSALVTTSPRTSPAAADALESAIDVPALFYRWQPNDSDNPYPALLAAADDFIVTADSSSLIAEACSTAKPVYLYEAPPLADAKPFLRSLSERMQEISARFEPAKRAYRWLVDRGALKSPRDFSAYHQGLREKGLICDPGSVAHPPPAMPTPLDNLEQAVARVRALFR